VTIEEAKASLAIQTTIPLNQAILYLSGLHQYPSGWNKTRYYTQRHRKGLLKSPLLAISPERYHLMQEALIKRRACALSGTIARMSKKTKEAF
jgi:hypothetical protein